jgi:hypothetical protein
VIVRCEASIVETLKTADLRRILGMALVFYRSNIHGHNAVAESFREKYL